MNSKKSKSEKIFDVVNCIILGIIALTTLYPMILVFSSSISDIRALLRNEVMILPVGFSLEAYQSIFRDGQIYVSYMNTLIYTVGGTLINLTLTLPVAYATSRKSYTLRGPVMFLFSVTMFFSGGLIPSYLLVRNLGMYNTRWAVLLPGAISVMNLVMARTFLATTIPEEMSESAKIDGANDLMIFVWIALPLSQAIIAVLALYYGVGHWNNWYGPMIYLTDQSKRPMALFLRQLLITGTVQTASDEMTRMRDDIAMVAALRRRMQYASIIVTMFPILVAYPFFQKYFAKGVMVGALKG